jgi:hypothetical protein
MALRFGVFEDFNGATTLLLWSAGDGLTELAALFTDLAEGRTGTTILDDLPWAEAVRGTDVRLGLASGHEGMLEVLPVAEGTEVHWHSPAMWFSAFADLVLALDAMPRGHQYLDVDWRQDVQVIISKGEYPRTWPDGRAHRSQ